MGAGSSSRANTSRAAPEAVSVIQTSEPPNRPRPGVSPGTKAISSRSLARSGGGKRLARSGEAEVVSSSSSIRLSAAGQLVARHLRQRHRGAEVGREIHRPPLGLPRQPPRPDVSLRHPVDDVVDQVLDVLPARQLPRPQGGRRLLQLHPGAVAGAAVELLADQRALHADVGKFLLIDCLVVAGDPLPAALGKAPALIELRAHRPGRGRRRGRRAAARRRGRAARGRR